MPAPTSKNDLTAEEKNVRMSEERAFLTKLLESALMGDADKLETVVNDYVRQNDVAPLEVLTQFKDGQKRSALHFACQSMTHDDDDSNSTSKDEKVDIVERVLNDKWFPNSSALQTILKQKDADGLTPIMLAAQHKDPQVAQKRILYILSKAGDFKLGLARSRAGATAMHYAAGAGATLETIRALNETGHVALNTFSLQGGTPLHWSCSVPKDFTSTIDALIECGANVNAQQQSGGNGSIPSPLVLAAAAGNDRHAKRLLQCPDISIDTKLPGNVTLFHMAADLNLVGALSMMLEKLQTKEILLQKNHDGLTPLDLAAQEGHVGCVLLMLPTKDDDDKTPTEEDAQAYIEEYKKTHETKMTTTPKDAKKEVEPAVKKTDATEDEAQRKAAQVTSSPDPSEEDVQKALELKAQGNAHFGKKEWQPAYEFYTQAIAANPKEATFYSNRSACLINLHRPKDALVDGVIARALRPNWSKACYRMAVARLDLERFEDAALAAWEGLQLDQNNDELKSFLQKCVKKGRQDFQQSKEASPSR